MHIELKGVYWRVINNYLDINSSSYLFGNFFSTYSLLSFLETQEIYGSSSKLLFVSWFLNFFYFLLLNSERSWNQATPTVVTIILNDFFTCLTNAIYSNFTFSSLCITDASLFFFNIYILCEMVSWYSQEHYNVWLLCSCAISLWLLLPTSKKWASEGLYLVNWVNFRVFIIQN